MKLFLLILIALIIFSGCNSNILSPDSPGPDVNIDFSLPKDSFVKITLENSYNTIVAVLLNNQVSAGTHRVSFDTYRFPSGIYFVTINAKGINDKSYFEVNRNILIIKR